MNNITITIAKGELMKSAESLLWKYGVATENDGNAKQTHNIKADSVGHAVDLRVLGDTFSKRFDQSVDLVRDYLTSVSGADIKTVALAFSTRWKGSAYTLQDAVTKYILDGMMTDYLIVTAPNEVKMYESQLEDDKKNIVSIIHSLGKPAIA